MDEITDMVTLTGHPCMLHWVGWTSLLCNLFLYLRIVNKGLLRGSLNKEAGFVKSTLLNNGFIHLQVTWKQGCQTRPRGFIRFFNDSRSNSRNTLTMPLKLLMVGAELRQKWHLPLKNYGLTPMWEMVLNPSASPSVHIFPGFSL